MPERVFVAIPIPLRCSRALHRQGLRWHSTRPSWVAVENYHLTLAFLGAVTDTQITALGTALPGLAHLLPTSLSVREIGPFPREQGSVLAALIAPEHPLMKLREQLTQLLVSLAFPTEDHRSYRPHITLARGRGSWRQPENYRFEAFSFQPRHIGIYAGIHLPEGYRYHPYFRIARKAGSKSG